MRFADPDATRRGALPDASVVVRVQSALLVGDRPMPNGGPVIKHNAQQRLAEVCRLAEVPTQRYVHRTDLPCGSTIGPITATLLGIPTVDVGGAMLSMHPCRELAGSQDPAWMVRALTALLASAW